MGGFLLSCVMDLPIVEQDYFDAVLPFIKYFRWTGDIHIVMPYGSFIEWNSACDVFDNLRVVDNTHAFGDYELKGRILDIGTRKYILKRLNFTADLQKLKDIEDSINF